MFFGKGPAGVGFEVLLEDDGFVLIAKGDDCLDVSGKVFGGVEELSAVVSFKAGFRVCGDSGIVVDVV